MRNKIYKAILIFSMFILMVLLTIGLSENAQANNTNSGNLKIWPISNNGSYDVLIIRDIETNCEYIVVSRDEYQATSVAIYPRVNKDGTMYVAK